MVELRPKIRRLGVVILVLLGAEGRVPGSPTWVSSSWSTVPCAAMKPLAEEGRIVTIMVHVCDVPRAGEALLKAAPFGARRIDEVLWLIAPRTKIKSAAGRPAQLPVVVTVGSGARATAAPSSWKVRRLSCSLIARCMRIWRFSGQRRPVGMK